VRRGFTLVELVVVLAIIAVLTHLAVRETWRIRDRELSKKADLQLEEIRDSVYARAGSGSGGFLADMGRMPRLADGTLSELWKAPTNALAYGVRRAVAPNLCANVPEAPNVYVPTGWRGPYLRLPAGKSRLRDPWGNPVESVDSAGLTRLWDTNGTVVAVSHYGPSARAEGERRLTLAPEGGAESRLVVMSDTDGEVSWYGPCDGLVTGATAAVTAASPAVFDGLTPGERVLVFSGRARTVEIRPGDNLVSLHD
jgi:prepilin-type N-terminal cleavage/methylation domain-containing protein